MGTASVTIKVTDSTTPSPQSAASNLSIKISPATLAVTTTSLPGGAAASPYPSTTLQASGGVTSLYLGAGIRQQLACRVEFVGWRSPLRNAGCRIRRTYPLTFVVTDSFTPPETAKATLTLTISGAPADQLSP